MQESSRRLLNELAKVDDGQLNAYADKGRVIFMIQDAPDELRRLADALEKVNINEIQALVAYQLPQDQQKPSFPEKATEPRPARRRAGGG